MSNNAPAYILAALLCSVLLAISVERAMHTWPATLIANKPV